MPVKVALAGAVLGGRPLYHFSSFDIERLAQTLHENQIYFSRPAEFNDPFDCSPYVDLDAVDDAAVRHRWVTEYASAVQRQFGDLALAAIQPKVNASLETAAAAKELLSDLPQSLVATLQGKYRVYCLCEHLREVRMWSHYGGKHRGIALEFSTQGTFFSVAARVTYAERPLAIDPEATDGSDLYVGGLLTKAVSWGDESEYRVIATDEQTEGFVHSIAGMAPFPAEELVAIYVGCNAAPACVRAVVNEASHREKPLPVWQMVAEPHTLKLSTKQISPKT